MSLFSRIAESWDEKLHPRGDHGRWGDAGVRARSRTAAMTGDTGDQARSLLDRVRYGEIPMERVTAAAALGDPAAKSLSPNTPPVNDADYDALESTLVTLGASGELQAPVFAAIQRGLETMWHKDPTRREIANTVDRVRDYLADKSPEKQEAAHSAVDTITYERGSDKRGLLLYGIQVALNKLADLGQDSDDKAEGLRRISEVLGPDEEARQKRDLIAALLRRPPTEDLTVPLTGRTLYERVATEEPGHWVTVGGRRIFVKDKGPNAPPGPRVGFKAMLRPSDIWPKKLKEERALRCGSVAVSLYKPKRKKTRTETTDLPTAYGITRPMTGRTGLGSSPDSPVQMRFGRRPLRISLKK